MKINERLNFVIPLYGDDDKITGYVHATPISYESFEANTWIIAKTYAAIYDGGLNHTAGPRVASLVMRDVAKQMAKDDNPENIVGPFMADVKRLMSAIVPSESGWAPMPYEVACAKGLIDREDQTEVESAVVFFTVDSFMLPRGIRRDLMAGAAQLWSARLLSLNPTEFAVSLTTSTVAANTGEKAKASSE